ncbi:MAG: cell division protein FtsH [Planctomycetota bacterium]|nr:cell division protein FtsH [Planctomycetota bacterium]MDA1180009.1 cell division protein FtsH [Planctomycetota bacterium]
MPEDANADPLAHQTPAAIRLTATAFHEAGHAVMAVSLGRPVQKVSISPAQLHSGGTRLGVCELQKGRVRASKDAVEDEILILFAGMVAESQFTGSYCHRGAARDLTAIRRLMQARASNERQMMRQERRLLDKTEYLLNDDGYRRAVELIARQLVEKTTMSGRAVRHLFEQSVQESP